ncbi:MAG: hypothetical protein SVR08_08785 [Spirochaetota bacterium]|nr:hypothetical protein [Spirochaetota bacterium]
METIRDIIQQNPYIATGIAVILIFLGGILFKKLKGFAIILVLLASFILYFMVFIDMVEKEDIKNIQKKVKDKLVDEYKKLD